MNTPYTSRAAVAGDAASIAEIHVDGWRAAYRGIVPEAYLDALSKQERAKRWSMDLQQRPGGVLLAFAAGALHGWVSFGPSRDSEGPGEIYALYVSPPHQRQGAGSHLLAAAEDALSKAGFASATLWVLAANAPARSFYERAGYAADKAEKPVEIGGATLIECRYAKPLARPPS